MPETTTFGTPLLTSQERDDNLTEVENDVGHLSCGLAGTCPECQSAYGMEPREFYHAVHETYEVFDEGGFSRYQCEGCGSRLGGDRYAAHGMKKVDGKWQMTHLDVCSDCLMIIANGEPEFPNEQEEA